MFIPQKYVSRKLAYVSKRKDSMFGRNKSTAMYSYIFIEKYRKINLGFKIKIIIILCSINEIGFKT